MYECRNGTRVHAVVVETEAQSPMVALRLHKYAQEPRVLAPFAPAVDTTAGSNSNTPSPPHKLVGPQIFDASKATPVEDPSLVSVPGYTVQLSENQIAEAQKHADDKLFALYPKTRGHVSRRHLVPPSLGGRLISNTSYKYSSSLTSQSDIQVYYAKYCSAFIYFFVINSVSIYVTVQGLYLCGRDMSTFGLSGDVQSGWVTANAVLGYTSADLLAGRNVASDLSFVK